MAPTSLLQLPHNRVPLLSPRGPDPINGQDGLDTAPASSSVSQVWLIVCVIAGALIIVSVAVFLVLERVRRRQYRQAARGEAHLGLGGGQGKAHHHHHRARSSTASSHSTIKSPRGRKLSEAEQWQEDEALRLDIIRKSLASRTTTLASSNRSSRDVDASPDYYADDGTTAAGSDAGEQQHRPRYGDHNHHDNHHHHHPRTQPSTPGIRDDWKAWEARMVRERSNSGEPHPVAEQPPLSSPGRGWPPSAAAPREFVSPSPVSSAGGGRPTSPPSSSSSSSSSGSASSQQQRVRRHPPPPAFTFTDDGRYAQHLPTVPGHSLPPSPGRSPLLKGRSPPPSPGFARGNDAGRSQDGPAGLEPVYFH